MNRNSGVHVRSSGPHGNHPSLDLDLEAVKLVAELTDSLDTSVILSQGVWINDQRGTILIEMIARSWVERQHIVCRKAWKDNVDLDEDGGHSLLRNLKIIARRKALTTWSRRQGRPATNQNFEDVKEVRRFSTSTPPPLLSAF
jgi:hypothetical protein